MCLLLFVFTLGLETVRDRLIATCGSGSEVACEVELDAGAVNAMPLLVEETMRRLHGNASHSAPLPLLSMALARFLK